MFIPKIKIKVLDILKSEDLPLTAKGIGSKLSMKSHSIAQQLTSYRLQGLVSREKKNLGYDPTKKQDAYTREYYYSITEKGKSRLKFLEEESTS